jgi:hypothetical protein
MLPLPNRGGSRIFRTLVKNFVAEHCMGEGVLLTGGPGGVAKQINIFYMCSVYEKM